MLYTLFSSIPPLIDVFSLAYLMCMYFSMCTFKNGHILQGAFVKVLKPWISKLKVYLFRICFLVVKIYQKQGEIQLDHVIPPIFSV